MSVINNVFYVGSTNPFEIRGLKDAVSGAFINNADVTLTLLNSDGDEISGVTWPLDMDYVAASDGVYRVVVSDALAITADTAGTARVNVDSADPLVEAQFDFAVLFLARTQASLAWTSRAELERMFGVLSISQWSDLDGTQDADLISQRIQDACDDATSDARTMLRRSPVKCDSELFVPSRALRLQVTKLAGVLLYEARGVVDTSDESGKHRLSNIRDAANKWFRRVQANQIQIDDDVTKVYPAFVEQDDTITLEHILDGTVSIAEVIWAV